MPRTVLGQEELGMEGNPVWTGNLFGWPIDLLMEEKDALFGEIDTRFNGIYQANVVGKSFDVKR